MNPSTTQARRRYAAFTLIEVLLAVGIATGLLLAALYFYRQSTELRGQIIRNSGELAVVRLTLDQIASDLRNAVPNTGQPFVGGPVSLEFARFAAPATSLQSSNLTPIPSQPAIESVRIDTLIQQDGTNLSVRGISRRIGTPSPARSPVSTNEVDEASVVPEVNRVVESTNAPAIGGPLIPVRFLALRYWNGSAWQDSWMAPTPPTGVEISIGLEPLPADTPPETYPHERFRRVVFIPSGRNPDGAETNSPATSL
jgi:type II secretory pathway pseudopilin PulG